MAIKKEKNGFLSIIGRGIEKVADNFAGWLEHAFGFEKNIHRYVVYVVILVIGFVAIFMGLKQIIATLFSGIEEGIAYLVLGIILLCVAWAYKKYY